MLLDSSSLQQNVTHKVAIRKHVTKRFEERDTIKTTKHPPGHLKILILVKEQRWMVQGLLNYYMTKWNCINTLITARYLTMMGFHLPDQMYFRMFRIGIAWQHCCFFFKWKFRGNCQKENFRKTTFFYRRIERGYSRSLDEINLGCLLWQIDSQHHPPPPSSNQ